MDWFSQATIDFRRTRNIYAIVLRKDLSNTFAKESDEERVIVVRDSARRDSTTRGDSASTAGLRIAPAAPPRGGGTATVVDFDGIEYRILALPMPAAELSQLRAGEA